MELLINAVPNTMKPHEVYAVADKHQMKHDWLSEDQDDDSDIPWYPLGHTSSYIPLPSENLQLDDTRDLSLDSSSEQYELTPDPLDLNLTYSVLPRDLFNKPPSQVIFSQ